MSEAHALFAIGFLAGSAFMFIVAVVIILREYK
jgi:hypothetical protein